MMNEVYQTRLANLNERQKQAVDHTDGPLLVLAGPGTGKTELLSMRAAHILQTTDTLPSSILCLTFTDSGAVAMRERLRSIIGTDAYKIAIHTFHGFGTEIINQNGEYFYHGAEFRPADELKQYEILRDIFSELEYTNPLAGMNGDEYTHLSDTLTVISELKRSGLTSDELRSILEANDQVLDVIEPKIAEVFSSRINKQMIQQLAPLAKQAADVPQPELPAGITPLANILALSLAHTIDDATEQDSTKPITAWKNAWLEKDERGKFVFKDRKRHLKLRATAHIYFEYMRRMEEAGLYDYDDMILQVIHALETQSDLRANIQEKYLYIMVDEFQDTSRAQLRLLFDIADEPDANVMAVGDDDQAIYSFQGADSSNIHSFRVKYNDPPVIVLQDNYRSTPSVLKHAREIITQSDDRLENSIEGLSKELTAHQNDKLDVSLHEYGSISDERHQLARSIRQQIDGGVAPETIAVFARRHHELMNLLPYFAKQNILVNYERRDDALEHDVVRLVEHLLLILDALHRDEHEQADALLPEVLAHPAFGYEPHDIYRLSLASHRNHQLWLEAMQTTPVFKPFADWVIASAMTIHNQPLEALIDELIGTPDHDSSTEEKDAFVSPLYAYFFSPEKLTEQPDAYLTALEALRTLRDRVREHAGHEQLTASMLLDFIQSHRELQRTITITRHRSDDAGGRINVMTAHKSKGLEFDHVYIVGAIDSMWGERVRSRSRLIGYPENLQLAPAGDTYDERLRLFYVAMTRAKRSLSISYSTSIDDKATLAASFLSGASLEPQTDSPHSEVDTLIEQAEIDWRGKLAAAMTNDMRAALMPILERYKLSATHLGNYFDVSRGGPRHFLLSNLLRFPEAKSPSAQYGTAIHATLQRAHNHYRASGNRRALEDILGDYERILQDQHLSADDYETYVSRGIDALTAFMREQYDSFSITQRTELGFGRQDVVLNDTRLTGTLDLADIDDKQKTIRVTDYKTGKPSRDWKGKTEYEKMKLHRYRQQLMFYQLLVENSRDYSNYVFEGGVLQFVEPTTSGDIVALEDSFTRDELADFRQLISATWQAIMALDFPDTGSYPQNLKGIQQFEQDIIDKYM